MKFAKLVQEVGEWSTENFGNQGGLSYLAPFLGIVEECGEIEAGLELCDYCEVVDGFVDGIIFLADLAYRLNNLNLMLENNQRIPLNSNKFKWDRFTNDRDMSLNTVRAIGNMSHVILKGNQEIRGFGNEKFFAKKLRQAYIDLFSSWLNDFSFLPCAIVWGQSSEGIVVEEEVDKIWSKVKARNWKKNPTDANKVVELA